MKYAKRKVFEGTFNNRFNDQHYLYHFNSGLICKKFTKLNKSYELIKVLKDGPHTTNL